MSEVVIRPSRLCGAVKIPPSKSAAHRAILCATLSGGVSRLANIASSTDILATIHAAESIGVSCKLKNSLLTVTSTAHLSDHSGSPLNIDCGESGSTLRFFIPVLAALGIHAVFTGQGRLPQRPIGIYSNLLPAHGVSCTTQGGLPFTIAGQLTSGKFELPGNISSQFITGLLFALPLLHGDSQIILTSPLESAGYVDMTISTMKEFGVNVIVTENGWEIPGGQSYLAHDTSIEGDWSQAAFFLAAAALGGDLSISGLRRDSCQGDRAAEQLFSAFGADIHWQGDVLYAGAKTLHGIEIDASQIPDLVPILAVTGALSPGSTRIYHAERLRIKESDRLTAMADGLTRLGATVTETLDGLTLKGIQRLAGGNAEGYNDHRIVMALAVAALNAEQKTILTDAQSIQKSYPNFFEDYQILGGNAHVISMGEPD